MPDLKLEEFIYQVKKELIEAQKKHEDEQGYFKLDNVELNVAVTAKYELGGEVNAKIPIINLIVLQLGTKVAKEKIHNLKLNFSIVPPNEQKYKIVLPANQPSISTALVNPYDIYFYNPLTIKDIRG